MNITKYNSNRNHTAKMRTKKDIEYIVIHYVGALGDALPNVNYYMGGDRGASADFFVGHTGDVRQFHDYMKYYSWHCGGGLQGSGASFYGKCTNSNSIGIEMCVKKKSTKTMNATDKDWYFEDATVNSTIELVKQLMKELDIPASNIIRHYDVVGKICPNPYVYNITTHTWTAFKAALTTTRKRSNNYTYTVQKGDTLTAIAKDLGCTVNYLKKWNKLTSDTIKAGQVLKLYYSKIKIKDGKTAHVRTGAGTTHKSMKKVKAGTEFYNYGSKVSNLGQKWKKVWWGDQVCYVYGAKTKKV